MRTQLPARLVAAAVISGVLLTGCGSDFRLALPRVIVEVDSEGYPSVIGISGRAFGVQALDPATVQQLVNSNLQHVELSWRQEGVAVWVNAKPITALELGPERFKRVVNLVKKFGFPDPAQDPLAGLAVEIARVLQLNLVLKFPPAAGQTEVPLRPEGAAFPDGASQAQPAALAGVRLTFDQDGVPSISGVSFREFSSLLGADLSATYLPRELVQQLVAAEIQHITLKTTPEGIKLWVNAEEITTLRWNRDTLNNAAETVGSLQLLDPAVGAAVKQFLPLVEQLEARVVLRFPTTATPIPEPN
ncbi:MAG: hypothetical protein NZ693_11375 [Thermoflexales bacterium]|nr:hypothetical protein [Thermoflexales bacterium]